MQGVPLRLTLWPNIEGYISQTRVPFFSICLANRCCEMMLWTYDPHYDLKGPTLVCSSQKLIILTLGSGVLDTSCWLLQAVTPPKCQMMLCLFTTSVGSDLSPASSLVLVSRNQTMAGLSTPSPTPGGLSQQLYGTSSRHGFPRWTMPLFECRMSALMLDRRISLLGFNVCGSGLVEDKLSLSCVVQISVPQQASPLPRHCDISSVRAHLQPVCPLLFFMFNVK